MKQGNERPRTEQLTSTHHFGHISQWYPSYFASFFSIHRFVYLRRSASDEDFMR